MHSEGSEHKQWTYMQAETLLGGICSCFFFFFQLFHTEGSLRGPVSVHTLFWTWSWFVPLLLRAEVWLKLSRGAAWRLHWWLPALSLRKMCVCCKDLGHAAGLVCVSPGRGYRQVALGRSSSFCTKRCGMHRDSDPEEKGSASRCLVPASCSEMWENGSTAVLYGMHVSMHYMRWEQECRAVQSHSVPAYLSSPISASGLPQDWSPGKHGHLCGQGQAPETWADVLRHSTPGTTCSCPEPGEGVRGPCVSTQVAPMQPPITTAGTLCLFLAYSRCITKVKK